MVYRLTKLLSMPTRELYQGLGHVHAAIDMQRRTRDISAFI